MNEELQKFIEWIPQNIEELKDKTPDEIVEVLNNLGQSNEGKKMIETWMIKFKSSTFMFKDGGKMEALVNMFKCGGKPKCKSKSKCESKYECGGKYKIRKGEDGLITEPSNLFNNSNFMDLVKNDMHNMICDMRYRNNYRPLSSHFSWFNDTTDTINGKAVSRAEFFDPMTGMSSVDYWNPENMTISKIKPIVDVDIDKSQFPEVRPTVDQINDLLNNALGSQANYYEKKLNNQKQIADDYKNAYIHASGELARARDIVQPVLKSDNRQYIKDAYEASQQAQRRHPDSYNTTSYKKHAEVFSAISDGSFKD